MILKRFSFFLISAYFLGGADCWKNFQLETGLEEESDQRMEQARGPNLRRSHQERQVGRVSPRLNDKLGGEDKTPVSPLG